MFRSSKFAFLAIAAVLLALPATSQQVGVTSSSAGEPRGTPPAQNERILRVGIDIQASERVRTGVNDRAHLVFLDGSALTVGVDSDLVIDRFVYDPNAKVGDIAMTATQGAFRFVGGAISKKNEVTIRTPGAEIGIRGGIALLTIGSNSVTTATFLFGEFLRVSNPMGTSKASRYNSQIAARRGSAPTAPVVLPPHSLEAYLKLFEDSQNTGKVISPGDQQLIASIVTDLDVQKLPHVDANSEVTNWLAYLQVLARQGVTTVNANRPSTLPITTTTTTTTVTSAPVMTAPPPPHIIIPPTGG